MSTNDPKLVSLLSMHHFWEHWSKV